MVLYSRLGDSLIDILSTLDIHRIGDEVPNFQPACDLFFFSKTQPPHPRHIFQGYIKIGPATASISPWHQQAISVVLDFRNLILIPTDEQHFVGDVVTAFAAGLWQCVNEFAKNVINHAGSWVTFDVVLPPYLMPVRMAGSKPDLDRNTVHTAMCTLTQKGHGCVWLAPQTVNPSTSGLQLCLPRIGITLVQNCFSIIIPSQHVPLGPSKSVRTNMAHVPVCFQFYSRPRSRGTGCGLLSQWTGPCNVEVISSEFEEDGVPTVILSPVDNPITLILPKDTNSKCGIWMDMSMAPYLGVTCPSPFSNLSKRCTSLRELYPYHFTNGGMFTYESAISGAYMWVIKHLRFPITGHCDEAHYCLVMSANVNQKVRRIQYSFTTALSNPKYLMCQKRLLREFQELSSN